ncbi:MAG: cold-shock protein [Gammaproteobacteria bacterium]
MQTTVKKWFREKDFGFLDNGSGSDIMVCKADLVNCQYLKVGATVEFECHIEKRGLIARKVSLSRGENPKNKHQGKHNAKPFRFGVMT